MFSQSLASAISSFSTQLRSALNDTFNNMIVSLKNELVCVYNTTNTKVMTKLFLQPYGAPSEKTSKNWLDQCTHTGLFILFQTMLNPNDVRYTTSLMCQLTLSLMCVCIFTMRLFTYCFLV